MRSLVMELKILIHLQKETRHVNVVNLLGAVTKNIRDGNLLLFHFLCSIVLFYFHFNKFPYFKNVRR